MKELEVIIRGKYNSGKSTLAAIIARKLADVGANVTVEDEESDKVLLSKSPEALRGKTIHIRTDQVPRDD